MMPVEQVANIDAEILFCVFFGIAEPLKLISQQEQRLPHNKHSDDKGGNGGPDYD